LSEITHLIIDEIHERSVESDFLLIIMKDILKKRKNLKLILMSATLNSELFSHYFKCPVIEIQGRTFPVKRHYLEDIYSILYPNNIQEQKKISKEKNIKILDEKPIDNDLIIRLLMEICQQDEGAILIFLPGIQEIMKLHKLIIGDKFFFSDKKKFIVIPLHSSLSSFDQHLVFDVPPKGVRKIILSTNIAETSITIDDIVYVIDSGKMKEMQHDSEKGISCLVECMVSKANASQRAGRAGRVRKGFCYHLYSNYRESLLPENQDPEMLRTPLEQLCLKIIHLELGDVKQFLKKAIDPPSDESIDFSLKTLQNLYAIDSETLKLTPLGYHLATLPVDARLGKMILFGTIFKCLDPILTIAASTSLQSPFLSPFNKQEEAYNAKKKFGIEKSDHLTILKAFNQWEIAVKEKKEKEFCKENYLSSQTLRMILDMKKQFIQILKTTGFVKSYSMNDKINENSESWHLINAVVCAGLFPNVAYIANPKYEDQVPKFYIKDGSQVFLHPSSILHNEKNFEHNYIIYQEIVKTTKIFLRTTSVVTPYPLILFSEKMKIEGDCVTLDGWIFFKISKEIANLLRELRVEMVRVLVDKLKNPEIDISSSDSSELMEGLMSMIQNEFSDHLNKVEM
jgi:ATP-dependent RNA helicase DHX36